jgi:nickel transport protein
LLVLLTAGSAIGHKVTVFAWVEGDTVFTQSKFSGSRMVKNGRIVVTDLQGALLLEGRTDDAGEFAFKIPRKTALKIELEAGMGHGASWTLPLTEIDAAAAPASDAAADPPPAAGPPPPTSAAAPGGLSEAELAALLNRKLDEKLQPMARMLAQLSDPGPSLGEVLGGIGYIFGLMGVAAYVHFRRRARELERG